MNLIRYINTVRTSGPTQEDDTRRQDIISRGLDDPIQHLLAVEPEQAQANAERALARFRNQERLLPVRLDRPLQHHGRNLQRLRVPRRHRFRRSQRRLYVRFASVFPPARLLQTPDVHHEALPVGEVGGQEGSADPVSLVAG
jgi:hypothetical protein